MIGAGMALLLVMVLAMAACFKPKLQQKAGLLKLFMFALPLPWLAIESGWFLAEFGRQPWTIYNVLPTSISASSLSVADLWFSIGAITLFYAVFLVIELFLMFHVARKGPSSLKTGRYHFEKLEA